MSQHTPGPWTYTYSPGHGFTVWADPRNWGDMRRGAVVIAHRDDSLSKAEYAARAANVRLMTHSPEMLSLLKRVQNLNVISGVMEDELNDLIQKVTGSS